MRKLSRKEIQYVYGEVTRRNQDYWMSYWFPNTTGGRKMTVTALTMEKVLRKEILKNTLVKNMYNNLKKLPDFDEKCLHFHYYDCGTGEGEMTYHNLSIYTSIQIPVSTQFCHMYETLHKAQGWKVPHNLIDKYSIIFASWKAKDEERPKKIEELIEFIYKDYFKSLELELKKELKNLK